MFEMIELLEVTYVSIIIREKKQLEPRRSLAVGERLEVVELMEMGDSVNNMGGFNRKDIWNIANWMAASWDFPTRESGFKV